MASADGVTNSQFLPTHLGYYSVRVRNYLFTCTDIVCVNTELGIWPPCT